MDAATMLPVGPIGAAKQHAQSKVQLQQQVKQAVGKASAFQFWRCAVLLMVTGSTLAAGMWLLLTGMGDFIRIEQGSSFLRQSRNVVSVKQDDLEAQCDGRRVYMYDLPAQFNAEVVEKFCLEKYSSLQHCESFVDGGFGPKVENYTEPFEAWYRTEQFSLEAIVHERFKNYRCLTRNPVVADLYYLPYYVGLDLTLHLYDPEMQTRDLLSERFIGWLLGQQPWLETQGHRHFLVLGRIIWDFSRQEEYGGWGNSILSTYDFRNVTKILLERDPNSGDPRQLAIPYPTSFHPTSDLDLRVWQKTVAESKRDLLVAFAGGPRNATVQPQTAVRAVVFEQCTSSDRCGILRCTEVDCRKNPHLLTNHFLSANFCFQPPGDTPTRKAIFDCLVAGAIPVFFSRDAAYTQYLWHLPKDGESYSVFIDEVQLLANPFSLVDHLASIPDTRVKEMQALIRETILPSVVYDKPSRDANKKARDAFDITLEHIFDPRFDPTLRV